MRVRGELLEVRSDALAFRDEEATALLNAHLRLGLSETDVARLQQRTEGWAAALYLAALSLRGRVDAAEFIGAFAGDNRHVVYLGAEVLAGQPTSRRAFLVRTSVLERLCGPLCDAVTGGSDSATVLEEIERANLFLVPLDATRTWYRYHLFGELLRHELRRREPELEATLHRRASAWHRAEGSVPEAIQHAVSAGDIGQARELIAEHWLGFFNRGEPATVAGWLDALPERAVARDSRLAVARVWLALDLGRPGEAGEWLERAERGLRHGWAPGLESGIALLRAVHRFKIGDVGQAMAAARRAVELERDGVPFCARSRRSCSASHCTGAAPPTTRGPHSRLPSSSPRPTATAWPSCTRSGIWRPSTPPGARPPRPTSCSRGRPRWSRPTRGRGSISWP